MQQGSGEGADRPVATIAVSALAFLMVALGGTQAARAMCCTCSGGGCGSGFCTDIVTAPSCAMICTSAMCPVFVFDNTDDCANGCGTAADVATATPSNSPTRTATPSASPSDTPSSSPTHTPTVTPSLTVTPSATPTATITSTPTITLTPTITPTPIQCCFCPGTNSCGQPIAPLTCSAGCTLSSDASCDSGAGGTNHCLTNTPTPTFTITRTITMTPTLTWTPTSSPTITPTSTPTDTPMIPANIDPYKCYRVRLGLGQPHIPKRVVTIVDEFENKRTAVLKPFLVCNPSERLAAVVPTATPTETPTGEIPTATATPSGTRSPQPTSTPTPLPLINPDAHLVCYKLHDENRPTSQPRFSGRKIQIRDEVEPGVESKEKYEVVTSNLICLPAVQTILP
jgi:hypothetical protein